VGLTCEDYSLVYRLAENNQKPMVTLDLDAALLGERPAFIKRDRSPGAWPANWPANCGKVPRKTRPRY
jgi:hypothetical protein